MWREHATLSQELLPSIGHGRISIKPNVTELCGDHVRFEDGSDAPLDAIIYATGYKTTFPFLATELFDPEREAGHLYRRMIPPAHLGLIFAGLVQPVGPIKMPSRPAQEAEIAQHIARQKKTYLGSARYVLEVDYAIYSKQMLKDIKGT
jgi:dimethylaniline monooxygenase (N-oxide forming)